MAIITASSWQAWANKTLTGGALTQLGMICGEVDTAIKTRCRRTFERQTITGLILDAPWNSSTLDLSRYRPIDVSGFSIYLRLDALGDPTLFTSTYLLTMYQDYRLQVGDDNTVSTSGLVKYLKGSCWGIDYERPYQALAVQPVSAEGALSVTMTCGYTTMPSDLVLAGHLAVSRIREMTTFGLQATSQSWNSGSFSLPASVAQGVLEAPEIATRLAPYIRQSANIG